MRALFCPQIILWIVRRALIPPVTYTVASHTWQHWAAILRPTDVHIEMYENNGPHKDGWCFTVLLVTPDFVCHLRRVERPLRQTSRNETQVVACHQLIAHGIPISGTKRPVHVTIRRQPSSLPVIRLTA